MTLADCAAANGSAITASANVTSPTRDPNTAPNNASSVSVQVSNPPPVIVANGSLDTTVECATSYTDAGASAADAQEIDTRYLGFTISPHEECAVEEAVQLIEARGGSAMVLTLGPTAAEEQLRDAIAMGATRAVLLETDGREWDPGATAQAPSDSAASPRGAGAGAGAREPSALHVRGSKTVSVQGGTGRDAALDEGLQLSVNGTIAPGVLVTRW